MLRQALVIFDLDGTLVDSRQSVLMCAKAFLESEGLHADDSIGNVIFGPPLSATLARYFPPGEVAAAVKRFEAIYLRDWVGQVIVFPGAMSMLQQLKDCATCIAVVSSNQAPVVDRIVKVTGLADVLSSYDGIHTSAGAVIDKTTQIAQLLRRWPDASPRLLIGDSDSDAEAAQVNDVAFWHARHANDGDLGATNIVASFSSLRTLAAALHEVCCPASSSGKTG